MKAKTYTRISLFILVAAISMILFSYSRRNASPGQTIPDCSGKCGQNKAQTEFILWESLTRNLLSFNR